MNAEQGLLTVDESLASHASLVSMAMHPCGPPVPRNVTTLVVPNAAAFNDTVTASMLTSALDDVNTTYRVKKMQQPSLMDDVS